MKYVGLLFWKDFIELKASLKEKKDYKGFISSLLLVLIVYGVFIFVFNAFAQMYTQTDFGDVANRVYRVKELFTLVFTAIFIVNVIVGVKRLTGQLMDSRNNNIWASRLWTSVLSMLETNRGNSASICLRFSLITLPTFLYSLK